MFNRPFNSLFFRNAKHLNYILFRAYSNNATVTPFHFRNLYNQILKTSHNGSNLPPLINFDRKFHSIAVNHSRNVLLSNLYRRPIGIWLFTCSSLTLAIMLLGAYTRLTESGLSITEWSILGSFLPLTSDQWQIEFDKYKNTPEYATVNNQITINEFKKIYITEWLHRFVARFTGLVYISGLSYFTLKKAIEPKFKLPIYSIGLLGAAQSVVGMIMVKSGLKEPVEGETPRVSPLILSFHLLTGLAIYSLCFYNALKLIKPKPAVDILKDVQHIKGIKRLTYLLCGLSLATFFSGALVAGNDAGYICNTWPKINDKFIPDEYKSVRNGFKGFVSDPVICQFNHRTLAYTTGLSSLLMTLFAFRSGNIPPQLKKSVVYVLMAVVLQIMIGIDTLIRAVPVYMGVLHQFGAISVWTCILHLLKRL